MSSRSRKLIYRLVSLLLSGIAPCLLARSEQCRLTIDMLPDDVFMEIFDSYRENSANRLPFTWNWITLVHVCQRWRNIIFTAPQRLQLQLFCSPRTPVRMSLDIWPPFPVVIYGSNLSAWAAVYQENVITALGHHDRISAITMHGLSSSIIEQLVVVMQEPFPLLKHLDLSISGITTTILPGAFLGGSGPSLRSLSLSGIAFPTFSSFMLSACHLTTLHITNIPDVGYISPATMVTCLTELPNLESISIGFQLPQSRPDEILAFPSTQMRTVIPSLTHIQFEGAKEYFQDLITRIDVPLLDNLRVRFFMDLIFDIPQLHSFAQVERFKSFKQARVELYRWCSSVSLGQPTCLFLETRCDQLDWRVSSMAALCNELTPLLSLVERLEIRGKYDSQVGLQHNMGSVQDDMDSAPDDMDSVQDDIVSVKDDMVSVRDDMVSVQDDMVSVQDGMESVQWLELFRPFPVVQDLYLSPELEPPITAALRELTGERVTEVLPVLRNVFLAGPMPSSSLEPFVSARRLTDNPVSVKRWDGYVPVFEPVFIDWS